VFEALAALVGTNQLPGCFRPRWVSARSLLRPNRPGAGKAKGPDQSGPFYSSRMGENQLDTELPTQSLKTKQSTAQQHERHATIGDGSRTHVDVAR
jgi:hypothetical protein